MDVVLFLLVAGFLLGSILVPLFVYLVAAWRKTRGLLAWVIGSMVWLVVCMIPVAATDSPLFLLAGWLPLLAVSLSPTRDGVRRRDEARFEEVFGEGRAPESRTRGQVLLAERLRRD